MESDGCQSALLLHDGELPDVGALMEELGLRVVDRRGSPGERDREMDWRIIVGTPSRIVELGQLAKGPPRIAIHAGDGRTARSMLARLGVALQVRRPFHPVALRLLLLHQIYHGPEKRRSTRVAVGAPVRFKVGLRKKPAMLAELSVRGGRLIGLPPLERGSRIRLWLPAELLPDGKPLALRARVLRSRPAGSAGETSVAVAFAVGNREQGARLGAVVTRFLGGPAMLERRDAAGPAADPGPGERRTETRRAYSSRVIALDEQSTRVLVGRDISRGGMRVEPNPSVSVGDALQIAIHAHARSEPLVVSSRVVRDDGARGLVLRFHGLPAEAAQHLDRMMEQLPILTEREDGDGGEGLVVSEVLERRAG